MNYNGTELTKKDFNFLVFGVNKNYPCYHMVGKPFKYNSIIGKNSICLISYQYLDEETTYRKYIHIDFYKNIENLQNIDVSEFSIPEYHIIPCNSLSEDVIDKVISDIKAKHKIT